MHARALTLIDAFVPAPRAAHRVAVVLGFSLFVGLAAKVAVPLPFTPVPATMQTFAVLLCGLVLGSRLGALAVLAYLAEGLVGLPVFASGALLLPSAGYLAGFVLAAYVVGRLAEAGFDRRRGTTLLAMLVGLVIIFASGVGGLCWLCAMPLRLALLQGVVPFVAGEAIKVAAVTAALPWVRARFGKAHP